MSREESGHQTPTEGSVKLDSHRWSTKQEPIDNAIEKSLSLSGAYQHICPIIPASCRPPWKYAHISRQLRFIVKTDAPVECADKTVEGEQQREPPRFARAASRYSHVLGNRARPAMRTRWWCPPHMCCYIRSRWVVFWVSAACLWLATAQSMRVEQIKELR